MQNATLSPKLTEKDCLTQAYLYAYPLVLLDLIKEMVTNTKRPTDTQAPLGQLFHAKTLATPEMVSLTRPNVDTVYSQAYVDLGAEPYLLYKPKTDRYCSVQLFDGYSNTPDVLGTGARGGSDACTYAFTGPFFEGILPEDVVQIKISTDFLWLLLRTRSFGVDDLPNVYAIQQKMKLYPLSAHGRTYEPPEGTYQKENDFIAMQRIAEMRPQEFFDRFNRLAVRNPGTHEDEPFLNCFKKLGIGAGLTFRIDALSNEAQKQAEALNQLMDQEFAIKHANITLRNGWAYMGITSGDFGTDYAFRAVVTQGGFVNPPSMAIYPSMSQDINGQILRGSKKYQLHFEKDMLPPHDESGWWSLTAYDEPGHLIANSLHRYNINNLNNLYINDDGSVDLYIQTENPGGKYEANWLPVCPEAFSLTMRIYLPKETVLSGSWKIPVLTERS